MRKIKDATIASFKNYLIEEEKSKNTIEKYIRDVKAFMEWSVGRGLCKATVLEYKAAITEMYAPASVNSMLSLLDSFFDYNEWHDLKVKPLKLQRQIFANKDKELTKAEYERLLTVAGQKKNRQLYYLMQTICSTGIRVSELRYIDINAVKTGRAIISCKGKMRIILLPKELCKMLCRYARENGIYSGAVFVSRNG